MIVNDSNGVAMIVPDHFTKAGTTRWVMLAGKRSIAVVFPILQHVSTHKYHFVNPFDGKDKGTVSTVGYESPSHATCGVNAFMDKLCA